MSDEHAVPHEADWHGLRFRLRSTRSGDLQCPLLGWHANISFAGPAAELVSEVIPLCNTTGAAVQFKEFIEAIHAHRGTEVMSHVATATSAVSPEPALSVRSKSKGRSPATRPQSSPILMFGRPDGYDPAVGLCSIRGRFHSAELLFCAFDPHEFANFPPEVR